jgi:hypothetical protein
MYSRSTASNVTSGITSNTPLELKPGTRPRGSPTGTSAVVQVTRGKTGPTYVAWEGIELSKLQFEVTLAWVMAVVALCGFALIGLLAAVTI